MSLMPQRRRLLLLTVLAAVLGVVGGGAAWLLLRLIALITNLALFQRIGFELPAFTESTVGPTIILSVVAGALVVSLLAKWSPVIRGHGIPEAMEAILEKQARIQPRAAIAKPLSAAIAIGSGAPFGAEGPIIVTGGSLGSLIGQVIPVSPAERKILLASGAAAGMAATFGTPIAAVILAIELLLFEFSTRAFIPLVVSSTVATGMHVALLDVGPLFVVPPHDYAGLGQLPLYAVLGVACGGLAIVINRGLFAIERVYRRLPVPEFWHPVLGAVVFGSLGLLVPRALGVGYDVISDTLAGELAVTTLLTIMVGKLIIWWIALASGTSGGTLAPVLIIAATFGGLLASGLDAAFPTVEIATGAFALVAMAATFGAATRATFASIIFVFEVTRDYEIILPLMLAAVIADFVAAAFLPESLMTEKLSRRGLRVSGEYTVDLLRTTPASKVMSGPVATLPADATVGDARRRFTEGTHSAYPIVGDGRLAGIVSRRDILYSDADDTAPLLQVASTDVVTVGRDDNARDALEKMLAGRFGHIPVTDGEDLVGMITRTDLVRGRVRELETERRQRPAWRRPRSADDTG
jgi:CIC family chloride channel protein